MISAPSPPLISIIVPVYNEAATVPIVIERLRSIDLPAAREIIVVNDGSTDGTAAVLDALPPTPIVTIVHAERNRGKGHAVRLGMARARGTIIAVHDADLELNPAELGRLVRPVLDGESAVVYGSRFMHGSQGAPPMTLLGNRILTALTNVIYGSALTDMETCYKVIRADVVRTLHLTCDGFDIEPEITAQLLLGGHRIVEQPISFSPRSRAAGKKIRWRDGAHAIRILLRLRWRGAPRPPS